MSKTSFPHIAPEMLSDADMFPELTAFRRSPQSILENQVVKALMEPLKTYVEKLYPISQPTYTLYRQFKLNGNRTRFEDPYFDRRGKLVVAVGAYLLMPSQELLDAVCDYIWAICEETTWILPAHERGGMDLFATETGFGLTEALVALGDKLPAEIRQRVEHEVRTRIIEPYLAGVGQDRGAHFEEGCENLTELFLNPKPYFGWYKLCHNNWNGVCNSSVGGVLLHLEHDKTRLADGLNEVLRGLSHFIDVAFEEDGASSEGVGYWEYGLINFVAFSELLRARTRGQVDLLSHPKMKLIAQYPAKVHLGNHRFYNHADCPTRVTLAPGVFARLAERTGEDSLRGLLAESPGYSYRLPIALRDLLWFESRKAPAPPVTSMLLKTTGIFRLKVGDVIVAGKAGHNAESHNHNDVGSFIVHVGDEDLLCDPGAPTYCREFFSPKRYELFVQANSRGHSVPVITGQLEKDGREFEGAVTGFGETFAEVEFAKAYPVKELTKLTRRIEAKSDGFLLEDKIAFSEKEPVEEAFVTWLPVKAKGNAAVISGEKATLTLKAESHPRAQFKVEDIVLEKKRRRGEWSETGLLRRITVLLPAEAEHTFVMSGTVKHR